MIVSGSSFMTRNDVLQCLILRFGLSATDEDLGRPTNISQLWQDAKKSALIATGTKCWMLCTQCLENSRR